MDMYLRLLLTFGFCCALTVVFSQSSVTDIETHMVFVKGGTFKMGSNEGKSNEKPVHTVRLNDFYIGKYEVTTALWRQVMGSNAGSSGDCDDCPVYDLKWDSIQIFIAKLNQLTGKRYRLPTEAEWEYAALGGIYSKGFKYPGSQNLDEVAWYEPNASMKTHPVGLKLPNELGLFDMAGNVWELCQDWFNGSFYKKSPSENPLNTAKSTFRLVRGGSWRSGEQRCQNHARNRDSKDHHIGNGGFRLVMEVRPQ